MTTAAAAWMDRLSDRLGALIPGCSRLPARHPIKVSVVMGALGLFSGWASMIVGAAVSLLLSPTRIQETPVFITAGAMQALIVIAPWAVWLGARRRWLLALLPYCFLANIGCYAAIDQYRVGHQFVGLFLFGFLTGLYLSVAGLCLIQRMKPLWLLSTALISALGTCSFLMIREHRLINQWLPQEVELPLIIAWLFSLIHSPSALCLGFLLWDTTPRPKEIPADDQTADPSSM